MPTTAGEPVVVIRSEERLGASTVSVPVRRAVLRRVIVAEERTITVVVRREELRIDYEDLRTGAASDSRSAALPLELVLHEEQVVVTTAVVPTERVRVDVRRVMEQQVVTDDVRLERVDIDGEDLSLSDAVPLSDEGVGGRHRK